MNGRGLHCRLARRATIALVGAVGLLALVPAVGVADEIEWMYDPDAVVEIHLGGLTEAELDALEAEPSVEQKGTFELTVGGAVKGLPLADVGIRLKGGNGSGRPVKTGKSGFKVRFDKFVKGQLFFGIKRLTLNNMIQDPSMVHETLSYELFHTLELPASRTGYAFVTLNGADYGLFLNLETLDEVSLPQWFGDTTQHLYEADVPKVDLTPGSAEKFEVDEGDEEDLSDLEALIEAVNDEEGDWSEGVAPVADLERLADQWAVERYIAHWDGYAGIAGVFRPNNYYLHSDTADIFQMMPWGTDQTWERDDLEFEEPAGGVMFNKCLEDADCMDLYVEGLTKVHCAVPGLDQEAHAALLAAMLQPYQEEEDPLRREATAAEIAAEVESVEDFAVLRQQQLAEYLTGKGVLGAGTDPCAPPAEPEKPSDPVPGPAPKATPPAPVPDSGARLSFGPTKVQGATVLTRLTVPGAGEATQQVTARLAGRQVRACSGRGRRAAAGELTVRCRLSGPVRRALRSAPLKLRVRVGFIPAAGRSQFVVRFPTAPKRP
jgi:CotH kinase protein